MTLFDEMLEIQEAPDSRMKVLSSSEYGFFCFIRNLSESNLEKAKQAFPRFYDRVLFRVRGGP
jgi:hypothetical protein